MTDPASRGARRTRPSVPGGSIDADSLRDELVEVENRYYANLKALERQVARLEAVQTLGKALLREREPDAALERLVELSVRHMEVEKALVCREQPRGLEVRFARGYSRRRARDLVGTILPLAGEPITGVVADGACALIDARGTELGAALDLAQAILCPLRSDDGYRYGLYVVGFSEEKRSLFEPFANADVGFFEMITTQVSGLLQNLGLQETFRKFVPFEFLELLGRPSVQGIRTSDNAALDMHVMFADLRGFSRLAETEPAQTLFALLNEYLGAMEPCIAAHGGFINQYQGDAIMALFPGSADAPLRAAIDMVDALQALNASRAAPGATALRNGIGLNSGRLLLGAIGSEKRLDSNVVGDAANLASRVEGMTKVYGARVLVSGNTTALLPGGAAFSLRELDRVVVAGKTEPVVVHELLDVDPDEVRESKLDTAGRFAEGLACYRAGDFRDARLIFADCLVRAPLDEAAALYVGRCAQLLADPPAGRWNGTTVLRSK